MTAFECFNIWNAIKLHFTSDYDYIKYNGKTNTNLKIFEKRNDRFIFLRLAKKYTEIDLLFLFIFNFVENDFKWIGDFVTEEAEQTFKKHQKILESMSYIFENDCIRLFGEIENPNELLISKGGNYPPLLTMYLQKVTEIETLCILNNILGFVNNWNKTITDTVQWPKIHRKIVKFSCFIPGDMIKYKMILKRIINKP